MAAQVSLSTFKNVLKLVRRDIRGLTVYFQLHRPRQLLDCKAILDAQQFGL